jgi:hypothetical protein
LSVVAGESFGGCFSVPKSTQRAIASSDNSAFNPEVIGMNARIAMNHSYWAATFLAILAAVSGCASSSKDQGPVVNKPSETGERQYLTACQEYQSIEFQGLCGQKRQLAIAERVMRPLLAAQANDPKSPLYLTQYGDVLLDASRDNADQAEQCYKSATHDSIQDWPPAWLGLARVEMARGNLAKAVDYIRFARQAADSLENGYREASMDRHTEIRFMGVTLNPQASPALGDPRLTQQRRYELMVVMLRVHSLWSIASGGIYSNWGTTMSTTSADDTFALVRADIELARAQAMRQGDEPTVDIVKAFDRVYQYSPSYAEGRLEEAEMFLELGEYNDADRQLNAYVNAKNRGFSENPRVLLLAGRLYNEWFLHSDTLRQEDRDQIFDYGQRVLGRVLARNSRQPEALFLLAKHLTDGGIYYRKIEMLHAANQWLTQIAGIDGVDANQVRSLHARISAAMSTTVSRAEGQQ